MTFLEFMFIYQDYISAIVYFSLGLFIWKIVFSNKQKKDYYNDNYSINNNKVDTKSENISNKIELTQTTTKLWDDIFPSDSLVWKMATNFMTNLWNWEKIVIDKNLSPEEFEKVNELMKSNNFDEVVKYMKSIK